MSPPDTVGSVLVRSRRGNTTHRPDPTAAISETSAVIAVTRCSPMAPWSSPWLVMSSRAAAPATAVSTAITIDALMSTVAVHPWIASCTRQPNSTPSAFADRGTGGCLPRPLSSFTQLLLYGVGDLVAVLQGTYPGEA